MQGEFDWDQNSQSLILGAFYYGYILTQVPGGWLAEKMGGKLLFGAGILCTSILTLFTPLAARAGVPYLVAVRVLEGVGEVRAAKLLSKSCCLFYSSSHWLKSL